MFEISIGIALGLICFQIIKPVFKDSLKLDTHHSKYLTSSKFVNKFIKK